MTAAITEYERHQEVLDAGLTLHRDIDDPGPSATADFSCDENDVEQTAADRTAAGHDVVTARQLGSKEINDARHVTLAVRLRRTFITYSRTDSRLWLRARRLWSREWRISGKARHHGMLVVPRSPLLRADHPAAVLDRLVPDESRLANRFCVWRFPRGWQEGS